MVFGIFAELHRGAIDSGKTAIHYSQIPQQFSNFRVPCHFISCLITRRERPRDFFLMYSVTICPHSSIIVTHGCEDSILVIQCAAY